MKFYNYLNESWYTKINSESTIIDAIKRDCSYYLKLINKKNFFKRYIDLNMNYGFIKTKERKYGFGYFDGLKSFKDLNNYLKDNKITTRDNSIFCTSADHTLIDSTLTGFYVFPIGKFNYSWIKANDFNDQRGEWKPFILRYYVLDSQKEKTEEYFNIYNNDKLLRKEAKKYLDSFIFTNTGINEAYNKKYEIWFDCKEYYIIKSNNYNLLSFLME